MSLLRSFERELLEIWILLFPHRRDFGMKPYGSRGQPSGFIPKTLVKFEMG
jgi:hypothetical protein